MKPQTINCQCGQRVLAREVLRTDLYERPNGKEYVYVKFRCRYCKQIGEAFVPERHFRWEMLESPRDEMTDAERESFAEQDAVSSTDVVDLHQFLKDESPSLFSALSRSLPAPSGAENTPNCSRAIKTDKNLKATKSRDTRRDQ